MRDYVEDIEITDEDVGNLIIVARAAKGFQSIASAHWTSLADTMEKYEDIRVGAYSELTEALKEVKHLL